MRLLAPALLLLACVARGEVREIKSMSEIDAEIRPTTLLVFDIDNTLVEPVGNVGSDQWYDYLVKAYRRDGLDPDAAETKAGETWSRSLGRVKVKPVEELTPILVREEQKRGLKILALTARGPEDAAATFEQLRAIGLDLEKSAVAKGEMAFPPKGLYRRGVFFVGDGPDKGKALLALLEKIGLRPTRVVYVDDKPRHVKSVDAAMTAVGIPCVAYRYGAADEKVRAFNEVMSEASDKASAEMLFHGRETVK
jgi:FMN phosphatase YigB (HAD superfamily)